MKNILACRMMARSVSGLTMRVHIGTSGYQYRFLRGSFYSPRCREADMLAEYAQQLSSVEVNNTFYRMPRQDVLRRWAEQVPPGFRFAIKASQRITHRKRLKDCEESVGYLAENLRVLGERLGVVLYQLPPYFRADVPCLQDFLAVLPSDQRAAIEFRHRSWLVDEVFTLLQDRGVALCLADVDDEDRLAPWVVTADFLYLRFRRAHYDDEAMAQLAQRLTSQPVADAFAYFKHEEIGPQLALRLRARCVP